MINHFYVTLPSNDGSIKYYPQNTNHSWKNRLSHRIDLEGIWEVGLASISLPCESLLQDYLQTLKADDVLLRTVRKVYNTLSRSYDTKITIVRYKDVRDKRLVTVHDLLEALFDVERDYFVIALDNTFYINLTNKHLQFDVSLDEESETCTLTAKNIKTSTPSLDMVAAFVQVMLHKGLCRLFQWIQDGPPCVGQDTHHSKRKQIDSREKPSRLARIPFPNDKVPSPSTTCLIPSISKPSYFISTK